ncbi:MAG: sialate O-acetylesterase [Planctomycetaceae bacterium]|nr:sialate O-acetylesterase [Planctomycetaceae bacterium]
METRFTILSSLVMTLMVTTNAWADVQLSNLFTDQMVLQRELPVPIFGTASPGEQVSVSFAGQLQTTLADQQGNWMVKLAPLKTSSAAQQMVIKAANTIRLSDILVGEVWLCSGQSNMAGKFSAAKGRSLSPQDLTRDHAGFRFCNKNSGWKSLNEKTQSSCSQVGYYFGMKLYQELGVPIGLIQRATSGTPIQSWMEQSVAEEIRQELAIPKDWGDPKQPNRAHREYDAWVRPLLPVAFRGVIWYQGERNAKTQTGWEYQHLLKRLIESWRETWATTNGGPLRKFPFYYVQVPSQQQGQEYPWLRDSMRRVLDTTENTGMAIFYDHGPDLHPKNKKPSGERLALWALAKDYGRSKLVHCGPLLDQVAIVDGKAILSFRHVGGGLQSMAGGPQLSFFEIAGTDGQYVPAQASIVGDTVIVRSGKIRSPAFVRYLFWKGEPNAEISLINAEGLPASSFMTDNLKPARKNPEISQSKPTTDRDTKRSTRRKAREANKAKRRNNDTD